MDIISSKPLRWIGDSKRIFDEFPEDAKRVGGFELRKLQQGQQPSDFKPMPSVGPGVEELRIWAEQGTFRVVYLARTAEAVFVLHAFQKKSQKTNARDLAVVRNRLSSLRFWMKTSAS